MQKKTWLRLAGLLCALWLTTTAVSAQELSLDMGEGASLPQRSVHLFLIVTLLSVLPGVAIMVTAFPFIVTVLSILRQAIGLQQAPPNMMIIALAMFLTWFVMDPVLTQAWENGLGPFSREELDLPAAFQAVAAPFREFMAARIDPATFERLDALRPREPTPLLEAPLSVMVPSFLISEISRAFEIGFLICLPFLVIDLVVAAVLMSMGMMMVPPAVVALPFKLAFFVVADGWGLLASALVRSYTP